MAERGGFDQEETNGQGLSISGQEVSVGLFIRFLAQLSAQKYVSSSGPQQENAADPRQILMRT